MNTDQITILGVGNILFKDEGVGIRVMEALEDNYEFPENVRLVDGGTLGLGLLGVITEADRLIIVDAVKNHGAPGSLYRLEGDEIPKRILAKNSLHQVDLLETLTSSQVLDQMPHTIIVGVEPEDIDTLDIHLTQTIQAKKQDLIEMVLKELDFCGIKYRRRSEQICA